MTRTLQTQLLVRLEDTCKKAERGRDETVSALSEHLAREHSTAMSMRSTNAVISTQHAVAARMIKAQQEIATDAKDEARRLKVVTLAADMAQAAANEARTQREAEAAWLATMWWVSVYVALGVFAVVGGRVAVSRFLSGYWCSAQACGLDTTDDTEAPTAAAGWGGFTSWLAPLTALLSALTAMFSALWHWLTHTVSAWMSCCWSALLRWVITLAAFVGYVLLSWLHLLPTGSAPAVVAVSAWIVAGDEVFHGLRRAPFAIAAAVAIHGAQWALWRFSAKPPPKDDAIRSALSEAVLAGDSDLEASLPTTRISASARFIAAAFLYVLWPLASAALGYGVGVFLSSDVPAEVWRDHVAFARAAGGELVAAAARGFSAA